MELAGVDEVVRRSVGSGPQTEQGGGCGVRARFIRLRSRIGDRQRAGVDGGLGSDLTEPEAESVDHHGIHSHWPEHQPPIHGAA